MIKIIMINLTNLRESRKESSMLEAITLLVFIAGVYMFMDFFSKLEKN